MNQHHEQDVYIKSNKGLTDSSFIRYKGICQVSLPIMKGTTNILKEAHCLNHCFHLILIDS